MSKEFEVNIEQLPHDIVHLETCITEREDLSENFDNPGHAINVLAKRQGVTAIEAVVLATGGVSLATYGGLSIIDGLINRKLEEIGVGGLAIGSAITAVKGAFEVAQKNHLAAFQIKRIRQELD